MTNLLLPGNQSAYRQGHSTETSLIFCITELKNFLSRGKPALMISLDLTSAFDTVEFNILIDILHKEYGFQGTALKFFTSYLRERKLQVQIGNCLSSELSTQYGVPQSSILGRIIFLLYLKPVIDFLTEENIVHHFYADDSLFIFDFSEEKEQISEKTSAVVGIFEQLKLKVNKIKTEVILFKTVLDRNSYGAHFGLNSSTIEIKDSAKYWVFI